jgi:two-component system CheB/CheR fusion protein
VTGLSSAPEETAGAYDVKSTPTPADFRIVGVGASAGGLESLEQFFGSIPIDSGMAFVVVQHLSPDFKTLMPELLSRYSDMPIGLALDGQLIEANHVYLLPPGKEIEVIGGRLVLSEKRPRAVPQPIDLFFRSLARDAGPRGIAVVLSGSGSDGSHGIVAVKAAGGVVLAESAETAGFDGMPLSAAATGMVDFTGAPHELAAFLTQGAPPPSARAEREREVTLLPEDPLTQVLMLLNEQFGIDFSRYKTTTVGRRLERRVALKGLPDVAAYAEELRSDPEELSALYQDLLIGVTRFFRDPEAFAFIEDNVVPEILAKVPRTEQIRVWVAGCASGEEAYSLAMLFHEQLTREARPLNLKVLATDMHRLSLDTASSGCYSAEQLTHVNPERRARYFTQTPGGNYQVTSELRTLVVFAPHNVMKDAPFTRMHLISCRNLLIYLHPDAQKTVLSLFHFGLASNGILMLGASETPAGMSHEFTTLSERWKIFRKRRDVRLVEPLTVPIGRSGLKERTAAFDGGRNSRVEPALLASYDRLLDRFMPPAFLIDESGRLLDSFAGAERLLRAKARRPTGNLLDMLEGDLKTVVSGALGRVLREQGPMSAPHVSVPGEEGVRHYTVQVERVHQPRFDQSHVLVTLQPEQDVAPAVLVSAGEVSVTQASNERMESLEGELSYAREVLQSTVEELETSNEELQATNEELVASNEELQSTNEELHSVNEELYTVNAEYQTKIEELQQLNADIEHLLEGTEVGTVFLDGDLRIRRFTARIARVFRLQERDLGREIGDFSHTLKRPTLLDDIQRALRAGVVTEDEVRDEKGTPHFLRILPYRTGGRARSSDPNQREMRPISGVVLTITDISALDKARERLALLSAIVESSDDAILRKDLNGVIETWNHGAEQLYGYSAEEAIGRDVRFLCTPEGRHEVDGFLAAIRRGERVDHVTTRRRRKDGKLIDVSITLSPIFGEDSQVVGASAIARDMTQLFSAQRELEERGERIRQLLDATAEAILGVDGSGRCSFVNPACVRMLGCASAEVIIGRDIHEVLRHTSSDGSPINHADCRLGSAYRGSGATHVLDELFQREDGSTFPVEYWSHPICRQGKVVGAVLTFFDITERKAYEDEVRAAASRRERFLAMLSHELRNPLAAVLNANRVLGTGSGGFSAQARARQVIERQGRHMARLLDDLLDVSRITSGKFELRKQPLSLEEPIAAAVEAIEPILKERGITLSTALADGPILLDGDGARLQQVVANLLSNAARHSLPGGVIQLRVWREGDKAILSVGDNGSGIEPALLPHIFELFVQSEQSSKDIHGGLGVGLALVRRIVELHSGTVEAKSAGPGQGSEFIVTMPARSGPRASADQPALTAFPARRIVLVEDQLDAREMMRELLELKGHSVIEAADGGAAVAVIERERPDVAVVDIGLPVMSGYEVAREIRRNRALDGVMLIALTGYGSQADVRAAEEAGFDAHLTKPTEPERLFRLLASPEDAARKQRASASWIDGEQRGH